MIGGYSRRETDPAASFLYRLIKGHNGAETEFLINAGRYLTALARREMSGRPGYQIRNHIKKGFEPSPCGTKAFIGFAGGFRRARSGNCDATGTTTIMNDRIKRSTVEHNPKRFRNRQCQNTRYMYCLIRISYASILLDVGDCLV